MLRNVDFKALNSEFMPFAGQIKSGLTVASILGYCFGIKIHNQTASTIYLRFSISTIQNPYLQAPTDA